MGRLSRVFTSQSLVAGDAITLDERASHYLARVLRLSVGDSVSLFNGDGTDYPGKITTDRRQGVAVLLATGSVPDTESPLAITLAQGIGRGDRMDYAVQKATELGVHRIQPLLTRRVEVRLNQKQLAKRMAHWQQVVISACEQCGRAVVPEVLQPLSFADWLASDRASLRLMLDPEAESRLTDFTINGSGISLLVGPEGGFAREELEQARADGCSTVSLGPRVLRTESAGPVAIAVLQSMAGDI